jgi:site-specific recombinase XerD
VFPFKDPKRAWGELLAAAKIYDFRFHDLRHQFASVLVMSGSDLNTVRELLGHADIKMTLRYSHLAHEHKAAAVERMVSWKSL